MPIQPPLLISNYLGLESTSSSDILSSSKEFIKDRLYFTSLSFHPSQSSDIHFYSIDHALVYINFYSDFGPNNLSHIFRFCEITREKLNNPSLINKKICFYSSLEGDKRTNAAFLLCAYMVIVQKKQPDDAYKPLLGMSPSLIPYRDAGYGPATYHISVLDCLKGLYKALIIGLIDIDAFNLEEYEFYERVENGDMNWISKKFIALANPKEQSPQRRPQTAFLASSAAGGSFASSSNFSSVYKIDDLVTWFHKNNVSTIIRLNNKIYDRNKFTEAGIDHVELYFPDGSTPPDGILLKFLEIVESRPGPIAVHCKAGLGRTGTLIAAYLMKHYKMTASEVISYLRITRPGSVVGPQQNYLQSMQARLWKMHPVIKLAPNISCHIESTFFSSTRFGLPIGPTLISNRSRISNTNEYRNFSSMDIITTSDDELEDPISSQQLKKDKRVFLSSSEELGINNLTNGKSEKKANAFSTFVIPGQPRKQQAGMPPAEIGRLVNSKMAIDEFSKNFDNLDPKVYNQVKYASNVYSNQRYNLRSAPTTTIKPENAFQSDFKSLIAVVGLGKELKIPGGELRGTEPRVAQNQQQPIQGQTYNKKQK